MTTGMETCPLHHSSMPAALLLFPWTFGPLEAVDRAVRRREACFRRLIFSTQVWTALLPSELVLPPPGQHTWFVPTRDMWPQGTSRLGCQSTSTSGPRSRHRRWHRGTRCLAFPRPSSSLPRQMSFLLVFHRGGNSGSEKRRVGVQDCSLGFPDTSTCALSHSTGRPVAPADLWSVDVPSVEPAVSGGGGREGSPLLSLPELERVPSNKCVSRQAGVRL